MSRLAQPLPHLSESCCPAPPGGGGFQSSWPISGRVGARGGICCLTGQALHRDFQCRRDWKFPVPASLEVLPGGPARNPAAFPLIERYRNGRPGDPGPEGRAYRAHQSSGEEKISHSPARSLNEPPPRWGGRASVRLGRERGPETPLSRVLPRGEITTGGTSQSLLRPTARPSLRERWGVRRTLSDARSPPKGYGRGAPGAAEGARETSRPGHKWPGRAGRRDVTWQSPV